MMSWGRQAAATIAGWAIAFVALGWVSAIALRDWHLVAGLFSRGSSPGLVLACVLAALSMSFLAAAWHGIVWGLDHPRPIVPVLRWYFIGELGKYLPGSIWSLVGRAELLVRDRVPRRLAYASVALGLVVTFGTGAILALVLLPFQVVLGGQLRVTVLAGTALLLTAGVIATLVRYRVAASTPPGFAYLIRALAHRPGRLASLTLLAWAGIVTTTWCVVVALGLELSLVELTFATTVAWVIGFAVIPAPGGLGVREAVFVWAAPSLGLASATAVALVARVAFTTGDVLGAIVALASQGRGVDSAEVRTAHPGSGAAPTNPALDE
jgi:glycosyltransferase 2 family protein